MSIAEPTPRFADPEALFHSERQKLWGLAYRLTGTAEDADDVVQEAFARLVAHHRESPLVATPHWLSRVATNLGVDALRRRRRRAYTGPWLPSPVETLDGEALDLLESGG